jgi:hypothetical protein
MLMDIRRRPTPLAEVIPVMQEAADALEQQRDELSRAADLLSRTRGLLASARSCVAWEHLEMSMHISGISTTPRWSDPENQAVALRQLLDKIDALLQEVPERRQRHGTQVQAGAAEKPAPDVPNGWSRVL